MSRRPAAAFLFAAASVAWIAGWVGCRPADRSAEVTAPPGCDAGDASFVAETTLSLLGRRPLSRAEVDLGVRAIADLEARHPTEGRRRWALRLMEQPDFVDRWSELLLDDLYVPRTGVQSMATCYGDPLLPASADADGGLAHFVLDNTAIDDVYPEVFNFRDLLRQSVVVDDVSPVYRAHLYAMLTRLNGCGNVDPVGQELAFREEIGHTFEAAYLNRDPVCLTCHTTSFAVTDDADPEKDRHWPVRGKLEKSVFGSDTVADPRVPRAVFRVDQFVSDGGGFDGTLAYCFDLVTMNLTEALCTGGPPDGELLDCGGFPPFCLSPLDEPFCADDGEGGGVATCNDTPFCTDETGLDVDAALCDGGSVACADPSWFPVCGDFITQPLCDRDGVAYCPAVSGEGDMPEDGTVFTPWGADAACGTFARELSVDDPADIDARFASVSGRRATVVQLEQSLKRGIDALAARGLAQDDDGDIQNPDDAFAYLVAMNIVDNTWRELTGTSLTIATHFPRNRFQRDLLQSLSDRFVASHFSLRQLLADIVTSDYVNLRAPVDGCFDRDDDDDVVETAFSFPPVFDPWRQDEPIAEERNNSPSDAVHALSSRTLLSAAYAALGWPHPAEAAFPEGVVDGDLDFTCFDTYPDCASLEAACAEGQCCIEKDAVCGVVSGPLTETEIQRGIGVFHGISEKGFRGLDFQARLFFEARFGACQKPDGVDTDAVDAIVARAARTGTVRDTVLALKERLTGETTFDAAEQDLVTSVTGDLDALAGDVPDIADRLRVVCGALLASPQFQLRGIAQPMSPPAKLQPPLTELCATGLPGCG